MNESTITPNTVPEVASLSTTVDARKAELETLKTRRADFESQLASAEGEFNLTTRRVNEGLASVDELAPVRARRDNLAELLKNTTHEIDAALFALAEARKAHDHSDIISKLRDLATKANGVGEQYVTKRNEISDQFLFGLAKLDEIYQEWAKVRAEFAKIALPYLYDLPPIKDVVGAYPTQAEHGRILLEQLESMGVCTRDVRTAIPSKTQFGAGLNVNTIPQGLPHGEGDFSPLVSVVQQALLEGTFRTYLAGGTIRDATGNERPYRLPRLPSPHAA